MSTATTAPSDHPVHRSPRSLLLDEKLTVPEIFEWNAKENPDLPLFRYHDGIQLITITNAQAIRAIRRAARYVNSCIGTTPGCIAIVANADTITYSLTAVGILRSGHTMFLISPRNAPAAVVDMFRKTNCRHVLVSQDAPIQDLVQPVKKELEDVSLHVMPAFPDLFPEDAVEGDEEPDDLPKSYDLKHVAMILHSSGSTNHPKPIPWSHRRMIHWSAAPWQGEVDLTLSVLSVHGTPMFHGIGMIMLCFAANNGMTLTTFPPSSPPTFPTPENVFDGVVKTSSEYVMTAPAFLEIWSRDPEKVSYMKRMKAIIFGGAPLNKEVGDTLASHGIRLYTLYGSTEIGAIAKFFIANPGMDWEYFSIFPPLTTKFVDAGDGTYELIVLSDPKNPLPVVNTKVDGVDAYATSDLLEPHPTRPGLWKYHGRMDDQIILSNGEKTNPGPLETIINNDPHVQACLMFGQGKFQNGVLIEPKAKYKFDPGDTAKLQEFRNMIWKSIERANEFAPQHSRIFKEMIMVASPSKPFTYNIKGYPKRTIILREYQDDIEALYAQVEQTAQSDVAAPQTWDVGSTRAFVRTVVERVVQRSLADDADLFRNGCDSLQATWIRNTILRAVREYSRAAAQRLPMNVVFQAPSITTLTEAVLRAVHESSSTTPAPPGTSPDTLIQLAEESSSDLPPRPAKLHPREATKDVVLITGTTGGFGCDVLEHLLRDEQVAKVYALNRAGTQAMERQRAQFRKRALEEGLLDSPKFLMVEASLDVPGFGLSPDLLEEIRSSITHIMHNAWTVNFSLTLPSFTPDLKAVRNLVELTLSSPYTEPPKIQFVSSIGILQRCTIPPPVPEQPIEPSSAAVGVGYPESKWVAEKILYNVTEEAGVPTIVVRLGQVAGDKTGYWNERDWFPAMVKSAIFTKCLPDVKGSVSFILGYEAARAFVEMRDSPAPILHLVHPRPVSWHALIAPIAAELEVPLVPYATWLTALDKSAGESSGEHDVDAMRDNPALRLLDFFRSRGEAREGREPLGMPHLATEKARSVSETLTNMSEVSETDAKRWIGAWRASGFLPTAGK
ncbi:acetyl-CoA synthetase-like protein [Lentinus tigrinus ALCF2SS1-7]|uniref:Acetyl-CoA synthetase-like protein n=1 Tax=Lentinus tigrinus ALCF2SS1-6 TaxID=1328759 RepID=A0A5C2SUX5_9APHY|nr:acetyl-CoA synthetase-like protein [Lentinus tigrinus ALCF2SS1-6]RPD81044.1 acetyl-CoA synthetase-like protein [Lentinus tigrinus ALCF2SS1-7]